MKQCEACIFCEDDWELRRICQHKASMEGIEAYKQFYRCDEVKQCKYFQSESD